MFEVFVDRFTIGKRVIRGFSKKKKGMRILSRTISAIGFFLLSHSNVSALEQHELSEILSKYPIEYHNFLRRSLAQYESRLGRVFESSGTQSINELLEALYLDEQKSIGVFDAAKNDNVNTRLVNQVSSSFSSNIGERVSYNQPGFEIDDYDNARHLGLNKFEDSYAYLVRIESPPDFRLKKPYKRSMLGQYIEPEFINDVKEDRNSIYDLFTSQLPPATQFRIQDVFQRDENYVFVRFETAFGDISPSDVFSLQIVDRVYRYARVRAHNRAQSYDAVGGDILRVSDQSELHNKESVYEFLSRELSKPETSFAKVEVELALVEDKSVANTQSRLNLIIRNFDGYELHPYSQFYPPIVEQKNDGELLVYFDAITLEYLQALNQSTEVTNIKLWD